MSLCGRGGWWVLVIICVRRYDINFEAHQVVRWLANCKCKQAKKTHTSRDTFFFLVSVLKKGNWRHIITGHHLPVVVSGFENAAKQKKKQALAGALALLFNISAWLKNDAYNVVSASAFWVTSCRIAVCWVVHAAHLNSQENLYLNV